MEKYDISKEIGKGSYGCIYKARNNETGETIALKEIFHTGNEGIRSSVIREISLLREMDHSNIIRLLDVVHNEKTVYLVLECMDLDLKKMINTDKETVRNPHMRRWFLHQILSGLTYCHSNKILHRDLKPQNLLIDSRNYILKLADFGSAREFGHPPKTYTRGDEVGSRWYTAPEIMLGYRDYSFPVDVWSVGCIFAEMVMEKPLFAGDNPFSQLTKIFSILGVPNDETWPGVTSLQFLPKHLYGIEPKKLETVVHGLEPAGFDLLSKMLCMNPGTRITAWDALSHPYFEDIQKP